MKKIRIFIMLILIFFIEMPLFSLPIIFQIQFTGISIHPGGAFNSHLMPLKLDREGVFVINPGIKIGAEYFLYRDIISIKIVQGLYSDCTMSFGGFSHIGFRGRLLKLGNHSINGGMGPTFFFRENWYRLDGYINDFWFFRGNPNDKWQWQFILYGGEFEYNYKLNDTIDLSVSIIPFIPIVIQFGIRILL